MNICVKNRQIWKKKNHRFISHSLLNHLLTALRPLNHLLTELRPPGGVLSVTQPAVLNRRNTSDIQVTTTNLPPLYTVNLVCVIAVVNDDIIIIILFKVSAFSKSPEG